MPKIPVCNIRVSVNFVFGLFPRVGLGDCFCPLVEFSLEDTS